MSTIYSTGWISPTPACVQFLIQRLAGVTGSREDECSISDCRGELTHTGVHLRIKRAAFRGVHFAFKVQR